MFLLLFRFHVYIRSYGICLSDLFHMAQYLLDTSMLLQMQNFHFLWLSSIPLYLYHIYLFINGHLTYFCILALINNTAVNIGVHVFLIYDKYPRVELLDHMTVQFSIFWGTFLLFPIVARLVYNPTSSVQGFLFLHILANTYLLSYWW